MTSWLRTRMPELGVLLLGMALSALFWPWAQDDYGSFVGALAMCQFSDFPLVDWYFLGYTGFAYLYRGLHALVPQVNWIGGVMYVMQLLGLYVGLRTLRAALTPALPERAVVVVLLLMGLLYMASLTSVSHTRASLIMCGSALLALATVKAPSAERLVLLNAMFVIGLLHRSESAMGMLYMVGLVVPMLGLPMHTALRRLGPPVLFTGLFALGVLIYWHGTDSFIVKIEPEVEYEMMMGHTVPLAESTSARDSSVHRMATYGIWFDTRVVTADAMRALLRDIPFSPQRLQRGLHRLGALLGLYLPFAVLLVLTIGMALWPWHRWPLAFALLLYVALCMMPLAYLSYRDLLAVRHLFPMLWIMAASVVTVLVRYAPTMPTTQRMHPALSAMLLLTLAAAMMHMYGGIAQRNRTEAQMVACSEGYMQRLEKQIRGRIIVITTGSFHIMDHNFALSSETYDANTYVMYDLFNYSLVPRYVDYQSRLCGCDASDPVQFFTWLAGQNALYLAEPERVTITANHMQVVHDLPLRFISAEDLTPDACLADHYSYLRDARLWRVTIGAK